MSQSTEKQSVRPDNLALGLLFGVIFGFLLQKGGVAKYHVLMGQLLLEDFTVVKIMLTAIVTGMVGVFLMVRFGWVKLDLKPTRLVANSVGGLIFGAGFGLSAYCPGTNAAAIGQGNFDGLLVALGLIGGSYFFAHFSHRTKQGVLDRGNLGKLTFPQLLESGRWPFVAGATVLLLVILAVVDRFGGR